MPIGFRVTIVLSTNVFAIRAGRKSHTEPQRFHLELVDDLPDVPVLPETLLQIELQRHEFSVDLHEVSRLILSDPGATLQLLRLAAREYGSSDGRPNRIEDCISDLGLDACLKAVGRQTILGDSRDRGVQEIWAHSREVAQGCGSLAGVMAGWIRPDEAWLVGLTHMLGQLPAALGWQGFEDGARDWAARGLRLAEQWSLPLCVHEFFAEMRNPAMKARWSAIVCRAHQMAVVSSAMCPMCESAGPQLCRHDSFSDPKPR
jgi:HD-like signal output (HDOD) protein